MAENDLANRRLQPLGHLSVGADIYQESGIQESGIQGPGVRNQESGPGQELIPDS